MQPPRTLRLEQYRRLVRIMIRQVVRPGVTISSSYETGFPSRHFVSLGHTRPTRAPPISCRGSSPLLSTGEDAQLTDLTSGSTIGFACVAPGTPLCYTANVATTRGHLAHDCQTAATCAPPIATRSSTIPSALTWMATQPTSRSTRTPAPWQSVASPPGPANASGPRRTNRPGVVAVRPPPHRHKLPISQTGRQLSASADPLSAIRMTLQEPRIATTSENFGHRLPSRRALCTHIARAAGRTRSLGRAAAGRSKSVPTGFGLLRGHRHRRGMRYARDQDWPFPSKV
jgi:hypothetical protein